MLVVALIFISSAITAQTMKIEAGGMNPQLVTTIGKTTQTFTELIDSDTELNRLILRHFNWSDFVPTGFYARPNEEILLDVFVSKGRSMPTIIIGTYNYNDNKKPEIKTLVNGENSIVSEKGGLVWVRYTSKTPSTTAKIFFKSGLIKAPTFIKGVDNAASWKAQLAKSKSPDVLLVGNRVMQVYGIDYARTIQNEDHNFVLQTADQIWDWENEVSGLDGSSPENALPVHNRMLMAASPNTTIGGAYAYYYGTAYGESNLAAAFTKKIATDGWGVWHELGHHHQQHLWTTSFYTEVTVNIYSLYVERKLGIAAARLDRENRYPSALNFKASTDPNKDFVKMTDSYDDHFTRLVMFQQLYLAFGDGFYPAIHKRARLTVRDTKISDLEKMRWFAKNACQVSGVDLSTFFQKWGFQLGSDFYASLANLKLPKPQVEPSTLHEMKIETSVKPGVFYAITSASTGKHTLDFNEKITLYSHHGGSNQQWAFKKLEDGYYQVSVKSREDLVLEARGTTEGSEVNLGKYTGEDKQKWKLQKNAYGQIYFSPKSAPNLFIDFSEETLKNGSRPILSKKTSSTKQGFYLKKA